jgi:hypothetical protein
MNTSSKKSIITDKHLFSLEQLTKNNQHAQGYTIQGKDIKLRKNQTERS